MANHTPIIAVLTGDLVRSREAETETVDRAMRILAAIADDLTDIAGADTRFTRFRGDGWQLVLREPRAVLRACLVIVAKLRASGLGVDTRVSVGLGRQSSIGTANLSDATGPAFFISGHHLDSAPKRRRLLIAGGGERDQTWQTALFDLIEHQVSSWTQLQAEAVAIALSDGQKTMTQADIARDLTVTRQAVQIRLSGAGYWALENALAAFESFDW